MEPASRPAFEPLADLPVEEPFGLNGTASPAGAGPSSSTPASATAHSPTAPSKGLVDPDEDLLAHGALLDLGPEPPAVPSTSTTSTTSPASSPPVPQAP